MATYPKTPSDLQGTASSPYAVAAGATQTSAALTIGTNYSGRITATVNIGSTPPTTSPTVQFEYSYDGTTFYPDDRYGTLLVPIATASTAYEYSYQPPLEAQAARVVVGNGATSGITLYVQGSILAVG